jgi:regulation of enolase protein 1 (concanavalin A-like superfamily)
MHRIYGSPHDPDKGTEFQPAGDALRICVLEAPRLLSARTRVFNAPRLWRDVEGDFTVTVRVSFTIRSKVPPVGNARLDARHAGGGLVVWSDPSNFLTATRNEQPFDGKPASHFHCEIRVPERSRSALNYSAVDRAGFLRVQRTGKLLEASFSADAKEWTSLDSAEAEWGDTVKVGVIAENAFQARFEVVFDKYVLVRSK